MKEKLKKLSQSTKAKIIAATIIPGGFLIWGAYELGKRVIEKQKGEQKCDGHNDTNKPNRDSLPDENSK